MRRYDGAEVSCGLLLQLLQLLLLLLQLMSVHFLGDVPGVARQEREKVDSEGEHNRQCVALRHSVLGATPSPRLSMRLLQT